MKTLLRCAVWGLVFSAMVARGEEGRPWAQGVSQESQERALALFKEANGSFEQSQYAGALVKYRRALELWDHPAIRFNAAVALINLDQPLSAYDDLEAALRYGEAPFAPETYKQALLYKRLIAGQFAELEVSCAEPGAEVSIDGEVWLMGPGLQKRRVVPGRHQLIARKSGFQTTTATVDLAAGTSRRETLEPQPLQVQPVKLVRPWPVGLPWAVVGGGAAVALAGLPLMMASKSAFELFDRDLSQVCPTGCAQAELPSTLWSTHEQARLENGTAISLFAVGGAAMATGVVLIALNGLRPEDAAAAHLALAPVIGVGFGGAMATLRFP